ncbi:hypothetical protein [Pseudomonas sp. B14-6]|nr:hypothetical protein [Pseudomonas sp. B14-6]
MVKATVIDDLRLVRIAIASLANGGEISLTSSAAVFAVAKRT